MNIGRIITICIISGFAAAFFEVYALGSALIAFAFGIGIGEQAAKENIRADAERVASHE